MYENLTYEMILQRMLDRVPSGVDKREGSVIWDALAPAAVELKLMYIELDDIMNNAFGDTAKREFLIRIGKARGIVPYPASSAVLQGEFAPATLTMTGKRFNMPNESINYIVGEAISPGVYQVMCETPGAIGNQYLGTIIPINYVPGLQTAQLTDVLIPGEDAEETEHLRQRYFESFGVKAYGGNRKDYLDKMNSLEGVGHDATKVTPVWNGGGTVKLTFLDAEYNPATDVLIDTVQEIIDPTQDGSGLGLAPIGHVVTVETASAVLVAIKFSVTLDSSVTWVSVQPQAVSAIQAYFLALRTAWALAASTVVRVSQIETRMLAIAGVVDIQDTTLNGSPENLTLGAYEIPVFGGITI